MLQRLRDVFAYFRVRGDDGCVFALLYIQTNVRQIEWPTTEMTDN